MHDRLGFVIKHVKRALNDEEGEHGEVVGGDDGDTVLERAAVAAVAAEPPNERH